LNISNDDSNSVNKVESEFDTLNISNNDSNSVNKVESEFNTLITVNIDHKKCYDPYGGENEKLWCKECVPHIIIDGWTSGNNDIDKFIKDTIYNAKRRYKNGYPLFLEWVPFDKFTDIKQIGEGGFAKVYSATWIDGNAKYTKKYYYWEKSKPEPMKVALKRLNGSQNISVEYLNEVYYLFLHTVYVEYIHLSFY
jgi:hypothetical protein